ncbi:MAG TPA: hypothetical protein V6C58_18265 [Allocoleopsis sp.]
MTTEEFKIARQELQNKINQYVQEEVKKLEEQSGLALKRLTVYNQEPKYRKASEPALIREENFIVSILEFDT